MNQHAGDEAERERPGSDAARPEAKARAANGDHGPEGRSEAPDAAERREELQRRHGARNSEEPDVFLDVPALDVDEIILNVNELRARVSLHAAVGNLVAVDVGADVWVDRVELAIKGVHAQALLKVHLDQVHDVLARALTTLDRNPELITPLLEPIGRTVEEVVPEAGRGVLKQVEETVPELGRTVGETARDVVQPATEIGAAVQRGVEQTVPEAEPPEHAPGAVRRGIHEHPAAPAAGAPARESVEEKAPEKARSARDKEPAVAASEPAGESAPATGDGKAQVRRKMREVVGTGARRVAHASARLRQRFSRRRGEARP